MQSTLKVKAFSACALDLFAPTVSTSFRDAAFANMAAAYLRGNPTPNRLVTHYSLSLREYLSDKDTPQRVREELRHYADVRAEAMPWPLPNVWVGVVVQSPEQVKAHLPNLVAVPAAHRFVSAVPAGGYLNLAEYLPHLAWVQAKGEMGAHARPSHPLWIFELRDQCAEHGVPFSFEGWGEWVPRSACFHTFGDGQACADYAPDATTWSCVRLTDSGANGRMLQHTGGEHAYMQRVGYLMAGRLLQGVVHDAAI